MNSANELVRKLDLEGPDALPDLRTARTILIGSDYSGQHATSQFEALGFVFADAAHLRPWLLARSELRKEFLADGRRLSYKSLRERQRAAALPSFLAATNSLHGLLLVVLVDKSIASLFKLDGKVDPSDPEVRSLSHWSARSIEKLLRVCHIAAFILAGLSSNGQDVLWITDQDEIAANEVWHRDFVRVFGRVVSHYLEHNLGRVQIGTTASDTGKRDLEDFVSIADIAAGAVCESLNSYRRAALTPVPGVVVPPSPDIDEKALQFLHWFSDDRMHLRRLVLSFEPAIEASKLAVRRYDFLGSSGVA